LAEFFQILSPCALDSGATQEKTFQRNAVGIDTGRQLHLPMCGTTFKVDAPLSDRSRAITDFSASKHSVAHSLTTSWGTRPLQRALANCYTPPVSSTLCLARI